VILPGRHSRGRWYTRRALGALLLCDLVGWLGKDWTPGPPRREWAFHVEHPKLLGYVVSIAGETLILCMILLPIGYHGEDSTLGTYQYGQRTTLPTAPRIEIHRPEGIPLLPKP
jgi:hypothetical protein